MPDAVDVYRRVLAASPARSVTIASVGLLTNLAGTLDLSGNRLSGTVPTELAALEKLQGRLHLHGNVLDIQAAADGGCAGKLPETCEVV